MIKLSCEQVYKSFKQGIDHISVLDDVTVEFNQNATYAITGVSGTGKSTFMHILAGLDQPSKGVVRFDNHNLAAFKEDDYSKFLNQSIGLMFQLPYLIRELSVIENVMIPGLLYGQQENVCKQRAEQLLLDVGLEEKITAKPATLSGGQQQRVALARALFNKPIFLLADEPTGNLDIKTGKEMVDLLLRCKEEYGMGLIISTHDQYVAHSMDVCYELRDGKLSKI